MATPEGEFLSLEDAGGELAGLLYAQAGSMIKVSGSEWAGTLYTPDGKLMVKKSQIDGALYSRNGVQFSASSLDYVPLLPAGSDWSPDGPPPDLPPGQQLDPVVAPEPSTLALLAAAIGGLPLLIRQRKAR